MSCRVTIPRIAICESFTPQVWACLIGEIQKKSYNQWVKQTVFFNIEGLFSALNLGKLLYWHKIWARKGTLLFIAHMDAPLRTHPRKKQTAENDLCALFRRVSMLCFSYICQKHISCLCVSCIGGANKSPFCSNIYKKNGTKIWQIYEFAFQQILGDLLREHVHPAFSNGDDSFCWRLSLQE